MASIFDWLRFAWVFCIAAMATLDMEALVHQLPEAANEAAIGIANPNCIGLAIDQLRIGRDASEIIQSAAIPIDVPILKMGSGANSPGPFARGG